MPHDLPPIDFEIAPETPDDAPAVDALIARSFGPDRTRRTVYRFRDGRAPIAALAFVARARGGAGGPDAAGRLLGSLNFWEVEAPGGRLPLLGPLAVLPSLRGRGVGRALVAHGLAAARRLGWPAVLIVGDPGYYAPHGFTVECVAGLELPGPVGPLTFMGLEFAPGALSTRCGPVRPV
ncbi:MAG: N-acetyltransferase [Alphaproteobacteria bacterium]|nr:N-acetyltransferase [Alphaproteobacteria bacterium]